jgi:hypothetical protein
MKKKMHDAQTHFGAAHYIPWVLLNAHSWPVCNRHYKLYITEPKVCNGLEQQNFVFEHFKTHLEAAQTHFGSPYVCEGHCNRHLVLAPVMHILGI